MSLTNWLLLILLSCMWGSSFFTMEIILVDLSFIELVFYRLLIAALFLWLVVIALKLFKKQYLALWKEFFIIGLINNAIPFSLIAWAQVTINSSLASILNATMPFFVTIFAYLFLADEKPTTNKIIGVVIGFFGTIYVIGPNSLTNIGIDFLAQLAIIVAIICYALATTYARKFHKLKVHPIFVATIQITIAAVILALVILIGDYSFVINVSSVNTIIAMLSVSIISTAIAYIVYFYILSTAGAINLSLTTFLMPIVAIGLGVLVLDEILLMNHIIGMLVIFVGLITIDGRVLEYLKKKFIDV